MGDDTQVAVVGGGPAGLATAVAVRRRGLDVTVLEQGQPGRDKACGEGLMPDGVAAARRLGVDLSEHGLPFRGIRYLDGDLVAEGSFPGGSGRGIRRIRLHRSLARAAEASGADLRWGIRAEGLHPEGVETSSGFLRARWIVGADGLHSRVRRWSGLEAGAGKRKRFGVRRHFHRSPWTDRVEVYWADGAEAYVTPVGPQLVGVALLWSGETADFDGLISRFPGLEARLAGAERASGDRGAGAFHQRVTGVVANHVALVGDASGYLDPITGEGMGLAFREAEALAGALRREELPAYARAHRKLGRRAWTVTRLLLAAERRPRVRRTVIRILSGAPGLFSGILAWMTR